MSSSAMPPPSGVLKMPSGGLKALSTLPQQQQQQQQNLNLNLNSNSNPNSNPSPPPPPQFPHLENAKERVASLISRFRSPGAPNLELEARFGTLKDGRFISGVNRKQFESIFQRLTSYRHWHDVTVSRFDTYVYEVPDIGEVRTRVYFEKGRSLEKRQGRQALSTPTIPATAKSIQTEHIRKVAIEKLNFESVLTCANRRRGVKHCMCPTCIMPPIRSDDTLDLRVALSIEEEVPVAKLPAAVEPKFVRLSQRHSFIYASAKTLKPLWRFDLTESWSGTTRSEAERAVKNASPQCEFETEGIGLATYLTATGDTDDYLALSLILKVMDFVGGVTHGLLPVGKS